MGDMAMAVEGLASKERITAADVHTLRRETFADGVVTRGEAEALFTLHNSGKEGCPEWAVFFVEALTDYIVHQEKPAGYISDENADWLVKVVSSDGIVASPVELELLVKVLEHAKHAPAALSAFALGQVMHAVVEGKGPLVAGGRLPGRISRAEVDLLRRMLYAFGGDGNIAITRAEAEILFAINERTAGNDPEWDDLFVKAIANFVMCASGYEPPNREEALRRDRFLEADEVDVGGFFGRMLARGLLAGGLRGMLDSYRAAADLDSDWEARNRSAEALARRAGRIDGGEAKWLVERIGQGDALRENERALLAFLKQASPTIHPDLLPLLYKVA